MTLHDERHLSQPEAARLAALADARLLSHPAERDELEELVELIANAQLCRPEDLPRDAVALGRPVRIRVRQGGRMSSRTVALVEPREAEPAAGRISVLSPLGRALLGQRRGRASPMALPDGGVAEVEIVAVERAPMPRDRIGAPA